MRHKVVICCNKTSYNK